MIRSIYLFFFVLAGIMAIVTCKKDTPAVPLDYKYEYFPVNAGHCVIYNVDSITYDDFFSTIDTVYFQIMECFESTFVNDAGQLTHRIERFRRDSSSLPWDILDVWEANLTKTRAEKVEENLRYIKLIFPPIVDATWEGNAYIACEDDLDWLCDWEYTYIAVDVPKTVGGIAFDSTLTVFHIDDSSNLLQYIYSYEYYAKGVGLISKTLIHLERPGLTGPYDKGFILVMDIESYVN